jgi:hypothetical protein
LTSVIRVVVPPSAIHSSLPKLSPTALNKIRVSAIAVIPQELLAEHT